MPTPTHVEFVHLINRCRNTEEFLRCKESQLLSPHVRQRFQAQADAAASAAWEQLEADPSLMAYLPR